ncbi:hypothetical protein [Chitinophaga sp.]|uniref:hypothetical protein n=1 Tax=Chitinophaga sp. TaxID=1869181 RepID=UPI0031D5F762
MKMNNTDIVRMAEIKLYFLDPPYTFKIHSYAAPKLEEVFTILEKYGTCSASIMDSLLVLKNSFAEAEGNVEKTRRVMKEIAGVMNDLYRMK